MLYPDLVARTCGFMGVLGTLIVLGVMDTPEFLITPQSSFAPLELQISSDLEASQAENLSTQSVAPAPESPAINQAETIKKTLEPSPLSPIEQQPKQALLQQDIQQSPTKTQPDLPQTQVTSAPLQDTALEPTSITAPVPESIKSEQPQPNMTLDQTETPKPAPTASKAPAVNQKKALAKDHAVKQEQVRVRNQENSKDRAVKQESVRVKAHKVDQEQTVEKKQTVTKPSTLERANTASTKALAANPTLSKSPTAATSAATPAATSASKQLQEQRLRSQVASLLVQEIKRKLRYPKNAVRRKLEGIVQVEFMVEQGRISNFRINKSSGHKILDDAAKKLAQGMLHMTIPLQVSQTIVVVPIKYELL